MDENKDDVSGVSYWVEKIQKEEKAHAKWRKAAEDAENEYFDERSDGRGQLFNLFYSTVNTLQARLFSKTPVPDVRRRYNLPGPEGQAAKLAAQIVERALSYTLDTTPFFTNADQAVSDFLIAGAGVPRIKYEANVQRDEAGQPLKIALQRVLLSHVSWRRFHWEPGKCWEDTDWVAFDEYLTAAEIKRQWSKAPDEAAGGGSANDAEKSGVDKFHATYRVTEVWYRPTRTVYVIGWNFSEPLEVRKDALALEGFYPCPRPMFANVRSRELVPTPDHHFHKESYAYINRLVQRIHKITGQIKASGFYDAQLTELGTLSGADDGVYLPVSNMAERLAATGTSDFNKVLATLPLQEKVTVVRELQQLLAGEKMRLDESNGIADIVRGNTNPNETATAQQIKGNWASLRLARKTGEVSRCLRDAFRLMAEVMSEHFTPESLYLMTGIQPTPQVMQVLKSDLGRALAIDVESDSTVALEDEADKAQRLEFLNVVTPFVEKVMPAMTSGAMPADLGKELLKFALQTFKHGRALEDAVEAAPGTAQQLMQAKQQAQQAMQQGQQAVQALQACQQELQKAQAENGKAANEARKIELDERRLALEEQKAEAESFQSGERHMAEMDELQAGSDQAAQVGDLLASLQATIAAQAETSAATMATIQEAVMGGLAQIAASVAQPPPQAPRQITVQRDKAGKVTGASME